MKTLARIASTATLTAVAVTTLAVPASARPGQGEDQYKGCPAGYYLQVGHCELINRGGPGRRAI